MFGAIEISLILQIKILAAASEVREILSCCSEVRARCPTGIDDIRVADWSNRLHDRT